MRKQKYFIIFIIILLIVLCGCSFKNNEDKFKDFIKNDIVTVEGQNEVIKLPSGHNIDTKLFCLGFDKEKTTYKPRVVLTIFSSMENEWYLNLDNVKKDMRYLGEIVIQYAENEGWDNDYYVYITSDLPSTLGHLVYDYETDSLHVPNRYDDYLNLYKKFKTFNITDISERENGVDYLVDRRIGRIVHNQFEYSIDWLKSYRVYISDGVFKEYGISDSYRFGF